MKIDSKRYTIIKLLNEVKKHGLDFLDDKNTSIKH
jgi:hypothetical protein